MVFKMRMELSLFSQQKLESGRGEEEAPFLTCTNCSCGPRLLSQMVYGT